MKLYEFIGKAPVKVKSRYGYAVDPIFEGLFLATALTVEKGLANIKQADAIAQKTLGMGVGPFTAHNLAGGNPHHTAWPIRDEYKDYALVSIPKNSGRSGEIRQTLGNSRKG